MLSDWSIYLTLMHMIGQSKMNERSHDMTLNRKLLDVSVSQTNKIYNKNLMASPDRNLTCSLHDMAEKLLIWC
jgi:hypothetical protein